MKIASATVTGFRLLNGALISLEVDTTIVVGRNNSGKTSLVEVFYKFLGTDKASFTLDDFSLATLVDLRSAAGLWTQAVDARTAGKTEDAERFEAEATQLIPRIQLDVEFKYDDADNLAPLADLILDLDPTRRDALLSCRFRATRPLELLKAFGEANAQSPQDEAVSRDGHTDQLDEMKTAA